MRVGQADTDRCWWCGSGERQTRFYLFVKCRRWGSEIRRLWHRMRADCERVGAPSIRHISNDPRATPAALELLEDRRVGIMPGRILMAGGPDLEGEDLDVLSLRAPGEEEGTVPSQPRMAWQSRAIHGFRRWPGLPN